MTTTHAPEDVRGPRVCVTTGLSLIPATGQLTVRVGVTKYGAINPEVREKLPSSVALASLLNWGRYDVPGHRTVYSADDPRCAYGEVLSYAKRKLRDQSGAELKTRTNLAELLDGRFADDGWDEVAEEWQERHHMPPDKLEAEWRTCRTKYSLQLTTRGWYVHIDTFESIGVLMDQLNAELLEREILELDASVLQSNHRDVTTELSSWVYDQVLDDGSLPLGITFTSRHGGGRCWATYLRKFDDGQAPGSDDIMCIGEDPIALGDSDFQYVCERFGLVPF